MGDAIEQGHVLGPRRHKVGLVLDAHLRAEPLAALGTLANRSGHPVLDEPPVVRAGSGLTAVPSPPAVAARTVRRVSLRTPPSAIRH